MKYHLYILQSQSTGCYYCGHTDDLERRIRQHNDPDYKLNATTRRFKGSWELVWNEHYRVCGKAMIRERQIRKHGFKRFLKT